jgi:N-acetyl-gamma-glutamyl-phosphate reductase
LIRVSILGATGYSGGELLRLLLNHSFVKIQHLTSESSGDQPIDQIHPRLRGRLSLRLEKLNPAAIARDTDVVFSCYPAGAGIVPNAFFYKKGLKVIDLSADFRLPSAELYRTWYHGTHGAAPLLKKAAYGLPELFRSSISRSTLVANPGCYATAAVLSLAPLVKPMLIDPKSVVIDAKSGVSGAGKKVALEYTYTEANENFKAYAVANHRHQPEIENTLARAGGRGVTVTFVPHLVPMTRGILSVAYATLKRSMKTSEVRTLFLRAYAGEPFVRVLPENELPQTKNVSHTNYCDIGITQDSRNRRIIVIAALDNLVKGAAGQAVQNMNLLCGRAETEGLL